jgi:hypothetical protein
MDIYSKLEFNRLIKELDFIDSDLLYKSSLLKLADEKFIQNVNQVLSTHPQLKEILDDRNNKRMEFLYQEPIYESIDTNESQIEPEEIIYESKDPKLKNLYRQIARSTHPDVNGQENLKEVYLDAQKAYNSNDLIQIMSICDRLKIQYDISDEEFQLLKDEITQKRQRIQFLESTYTWKWFQQNTDEAKNSIILHYLESQIIK